VGCILTVDDPAERHHMLDVLRMVPGDAACFSDGAGTEYLARMLPPEDGTPVRQSVRFAVFETRRDGGDAQIRTTLYQGVPKQGKMEEIVQKTVELGVFRIRPVYMARSVPKEGGGADRKRERWQRIAAEACKQCRRARVPEVASALPFAEALEEALASDLLLFPYEQEKERTIRAVLAEVGRAGAGDSDALDAPAGFEPGSLAIGRSVALFIGPEGGFSDREAAALMQAGAQPCSLGRTILRTETAGAAALAMIRYEWEL
jgi:16S rRNA (uracil1498-N3)-methyltransferase